MEKMDRPASTETNIPPTDFEAYDSFVQFFTPCVYCHNYGWRPRLSGLAALLYLSLGLVLLEYGEPCALKEDFWYAILVQFACCLALIFLITHAPCHGVTLDPRCSQALWELSSTHLGRRATYKTKIELRGKVRKEKVSDNKFLHVLDAATNFI
jgi:hypothetical protein